MTNTYERPRGIDQGVEGAKSNTRSDPDENGVELYRDRPREQWPRDGAGKLGMYTRPLDLEAMLADSKGD